jgi:hypothetical protein
MFYVYEAIFFLVYTAPHRRSYSKKFIVFVLVVFCVLM